MPIYEYKCQDCEKISEFLIRSDKDQEGVLCKYCNSKKLNKILSKSNVSKSGHIIASQDGRTCCGRDERCDIPPCSGDGECKR